MRQRWNRTVYVGALALLASAIGLAGCGGGQDGANGSAGENGGAGAGEQGKPQRPARSGPLEITMYTSGSSQTEAIFNDMYGDALRRKFPDVQLRYLPVSGGAKLQEVLASNTTVDLIFDSIGAQNNLKNAQIQVDLNPFIQTYGIDLGKFEQSTIDFQRRNGNGAMLGLPVWTATAGLYYNKEIFDKFGVGYPKDGMTWPEAVELSKRLTRQEGGTQYIGFVTSMQSHAMTNQLGAKPVDPQTGKVLLENDQWKTLLGSLLPFYEQADNYWTSSNITIAAQRAMFEKDRTAAMYTNYGGGTPPADMNWDVVTVPEYTQAPGVGPQSYPAYLSISSLSKNPHLAFEMIEYLVSEEYQLENTRKGRATVLNAPEILKQYGADDPKFQGKNIAAMLPSKRAEAGLYTPEESAAITQFTSAFNAVATKNKDINTALRDATEAAEKAIEALKAQK